jgi:hypothetical protein
MPHTSNLTPQALIYLLPPIGMGNGFCFTGCDAGRRLCTVCRLARSAGIPDLLPFLMFYENHGFFPEDIDLIGTDFQRLGRADFHTLTTSVAFIGVDGDIPVPRTVFKTVIGDHDLSWFEVRGCKQNILDKA